MNALRGSHISQEMAARARRTARERVEMLVHDRVIAALLAYVSGAGPVPAAAQARAALRDIESVGSARHREHGGAPRTVAWRLQELTTSIDPDAEFDYTVQNAGTIPGDVALRMAEALAEALRNSVRHAGRRGMVRRQVHVMAEADRIEVAVLDDGAGFDVSSIGPVRLGIARGIIGRLQSLPGGGAEVSSRAGHGTTVLLRWDRPTEQTVGEGERRRHRSLGGARSLVLRSLNGGLGGRSGTMPRGLRERSAKGRRSPDSEVWGKLLDHFVDIELREVRALVGPTLGSIAAGAAPDPASVRCREAELRDRIRGRNLVVQPLVATLQLARSRGMDIVVLDDSGAADLPRQLREEVAVWSAAHLRALRGASATLRLAPASDAWLVTLVVDGERCEELRVPRRDPAALAATACARTPLEPVGPGAAATGSALPARA